MKAKKVRLMNIFSKSLEMMEGYYHPEIEKLRNSIIRRNSKYLLELKSPKAGNSFSINDQKISFSYERNISHDILENKFNSQINSCLYYQTIFFSSGISAIYNVLISIKRILNKGNLSIFSSSSYFETGMINDILMSEVKSDENQMPSHYDVVFIETVDYNLLRYHSLVELLKSKKIIFTDNKITFIIIDSTLYRSEEIDIAFEKYLPKNVIIIEIMSLIKFYQLGMELSNVGSVTIYSQQSMKEIVEELSNYLKKVRNISGSNLSLYEIALLSESEILDGQITKLYKEKIYKNARTFFNMLDHTKSIFNIIYPEVGSGESPFIILKNDYYNIEDYLLYCSLMKKMLEEKQINIIMGSSFGFNHTRFELIITNKLEGKAFIKISIGAFDEKNQVRFANLFNQMSSNENITNLLKKYENIKLLKVDDSD